MYFLQLLVSTFVLCGILPFIKAQAKVYVQHVASGTYIEKFNGTNGAQVSLVASISDAQLFTVIFTETTGFLFTVNLNVSFLDKHGGCAGPSNNLKYNTRPANDSQLFTINGDGTIGSRCCESCLVYPEPSSGRLVIREHNCEEECILNYVFKIILKKKPKCLRCRAGSEVHLDVELEAELLDILDSNLDARIG